jgi:hypothetical protein
MKKLIFCAIVLLLGNVEVFGQVNMDESIGFRYFLNDSIKRLNYLETNFDSIKELRFHFTLAKRKGKWGWNKNKFIYEQVEVAKYTDHPANEIIFSVKQNGKWGVVDVNHKLLLPIKYENQLKGTFNENYITTRNDSLFVIAQNGKEILSVKGYGQLRKPEWFVDWGYFDAAVNPKILIIDGKSKITGPYSDGKYGFLDYSGRVLYKQTIDTFTTLKVKPETGLPFIKGFLLNTGGTRQEYEYTQDIFVYDPDMGEGIAKQVRTRKTLVTGGKWGVIDTTGKEILPVIFDEIKLNYLIDRSDNQSLIYPVSLSDSINYYLDDSFILPNWIFVRKGNFWGVYDFNGELIIPIELSNCPIIEKQCDGSPSLNNLCFYKVNSNEYSIDGILKKKGKYGLLNENGKILHQVDADNLVELTGCLNDDSLFTIGFLWNKGGEAHTCAYQEAHINCSIHYSSNIIVGGLFGFVNTKGIEILPVEFEDIRFDLNFENNVKGFNKHLWSKSDSAFCEFGCVIQSILIVKKAGKFGVFDFSGQSILSPEYDDIEVESKNGQRIIIARKNNRTFNFDYSGKRMNN